MRIIRKKTIYLLFIILNLPVNATANDFRNTHWGMALKEVIAAEDQTPDTQGKDYLIYKTNLLEKEMIVRYVFVDNQLIGAKYELAEKHLVDRKYVVHYEDLLTILTRKYGPPEKKEDIWREGDYFKDDKSQWGVAVSTGKLMRHAFWRTHTTDIEIVLKGGNFEIACEISYWSIKLKHLAPKSLQESSSSAQPVNSPEMEDALKNF